jgi:hypothetical protein
MLSSSWRIVELSISSAPGGRRFWGSALATDSDGTAIPPLRHKLGLSRRSRRLSSLKKLARSPYWVHAERRYKSPIYVVVCKANLL